MDKRAERGWTVPNILTIVRLLAAPGVAIVFALLPRPVADWVALALFVGSALTDFLDGWIARAWGQTSRFGAMLDPIADKAMVITALAVVMALSSLDPLVMVPAAIILFREVFVSGLREFLGATSSLLSVTNLAKWKTTAQMTAIAVLFASGMFTHEFRDRTFGMDGATIDSILSGQLDDPLSINLILQGEWLTWWLGTILLWVAALLTAMTGWDYFAKALPHLRDPK
ncbi:MAG: CDP-diacylglycerol--glycerol-3-phosphate 3-phosphatidyltransferase [Pseudomonadota bacterium]